MNLEDELDLEILELLSQDGRKSYRSLGEELGKSPATIKKHIEEMEEKGIIKNYGIQVNYDKLGFDIVAIIELTISKGKMLEVESQIAALPNIFAIYDVTGTYDAMLLARFRNRKELSEIIKSINAMNYVISTNTQLVLNNIKEKTEFKKIMGLDIEI